MPLDRMIRGILFLSRLFEHACTLVQKSYCYTPIVSVRVGVCVHMQNVRANVKVIEFQFLFIFSCIFTLLIILIKPITTKTYDRRSSGDCGTSGLSVCLFVVTFNLCYNFWMVREWDFIFGMHTPLMMPFQIPRTFVLKIPFLDFVATGGIVFHKHM